MAQRRPPRTQGTPPARGTRPKHSPRPGKPGAKPPSKYAAPRPAQSAAPRPAKPAERRAGSKNQPPGIERLQKVLAHAGLGSRRSCEEFILQGRVTIDGQVVRELGTKVDPHQARIAVDGQPIHAERLVYYAVHKPRGYVSTNVDPAGRPRVIDMIPEIPQRVYTVGRLDENSTGLILLTNDGEMANRLTHPKFGVEKLYRVVVAGIPQREVLDKLTEGVWLAEGKVRARRVKIVGRRGEATILEMVLAEGKNREVRRMLAKFGHKVMMLVRVAVGPITIKGLAPGEHRSLSSREVDLLRRVAAGEQVASSYDSERRPKRAEARPQRPTSGPKRHETEGPRHAHPPRPAAPGKPGGSRRPAGPPRPAHAGANTPRPEGLPPSQRPRQSGGPSGARPPRPSGPPPSQRPRTSQGQRQVPARRPEPESGPPARRIIGLDLGSDRPSPPSARRRPPVKRRPPRAAIGPRKARGPVKPEGEE